MCGSPEITPIIVFESDVAAGHGMCLYIHIYIYIYIDLPFSYAFKFN